MYSFISFMEKTINLQYNFVPRGVKTVEIKSVIYLHQNRYTYSPIYKNNV